VAQTRRKQSLF